MLAFKKRYGTEDFTPYMHLFVAHVGYWLKEHGDIESFANYDIESKNAVNKTVVRHASDRFGGKKRPKNHVAKMQMEREFRNEQQLFIVPQPKEKAINTKRKKNRKKENETPNKRRRVGSKEKPNWATRIVAKVTTPTFALAHNEIIEQKIPEFIKFNAEFQKQLEDLTSRIDFRAEITPNTNSENNCNNINNINNLPSEL
jgi:hypothetical protein